MDIARGIVEPDEEVVAVWRPGPDNIKQLQGAACCYLTWHPNSGCPFSWLFLPCCVNGVGTRLESVVYVLTTTHLHVSLDPTSGCCVSDINLRDHRDVSFNTSSSVPLEYIAKVRVMSTGCAAGMQDSCDCCFSYHEEVMLSFNPPVDPGLAFWPVANYPSAGGLTRNNSKMGAETVTALMKKHLLIVVPNANEVARIIGKHILERKQVVGDPHAVLAMGTMTGQLGGQLGGHKPVVTQVMDRPEPAKDPIEQILKLKELLDVGAITQA
eukprot:6637472-Prymnesium_polylepis.1